MKNILDEIILSSHENIENSTLNFNGRYSCTKKLGVGGLCEVYEARDYYNSLFKNAKKVAIKIPNKNIASKKDINFFIYMESRILLKLKHKNIVRAMDFGIDERTNLPYLVLEKLEGELLENISINSFSKKELVRLLKEFNETLVYMHKQEVIHCDISPSNIIYENNSFCLFDFGLAQSNNKLNFSFDKNNAFNEKYAAPEILKGEKPTIQSDIFSMAAIFYELFSKDLPYKTNALELEGKSISLFSMKHIPYSLRYWFKGALSFNKDKRKHLKII